MSSTREEILEELKSEKGLSFTALKERTGLSNGVLQYHIRKSDRIMKKRGAVLLKGACENCRFQEKCKEACILKELRKPQLSTAFEMLKNGHSQVEIADELDLTRATVNYHVDKLREMNLIES